MIERGPHRAREGQDAPAVDDFKVIVEEIEQASLLDLPVARGGMFGQQALGRTDGLRIGIDPVDARSPNRIAASMDRPEPQPMSRKLAPASSSFGKSRCISLSEAAICAPVRPAMNDCQFSPKRNLTAVAAVIAWFQPNSRQLNNSAISAGHRHDRAHISLACQTVEKAQVRHVVPLETLMRRCESVVLHPLHGGGRQPAAGCHALARAR
jgi:hypothetical protein